MNDSNLQELSGPSSSLPADNVSIDNADDASPLPPIQVSLLQGAQTFGLVLNRVAAIRFARFASLLEEGNRQLNLTRIHPEDVVTLHFLDSLALAAVHRPASGARVLDVGTGAGFPGVPLALAFPDVTVTLMDSTRKRLLWLDSALADLAIRNAHTLHARAEELVRDPQHRERYDLVVARAVAPLATLAGWLLPFARPGGLAVAYKSQDIAAELEAGAARSAGTFRDPGANRGSALTWHGHCTQTGIDAQTPRRSPAAKTQ